jgi:hypothetical protein
MSFNDGEMLLFPSKITVVIFLVEFHRSIEVLESLKVENLMNFEKQIF